MGLVITLSIRETPLSWDDNDIYTSMMASQSTPPLSPSRLKAGLGFRLRVKAAGDCLQWRSEVKKKIPRDVDVFEGLSQKAHPRSLLSCP
jgi:hypothetical protein